MLQKYRTHHAHISGERIVTAMLPSGRFVAYLDQDDGHYDNRGYGATRSAAIADLIEKIGDAEPPDPPGWEGGFADNH